MKRGRTKTDQQYSADILKLMSNQYDKKVKALRAASVKQTIPFRPIASNIFEINFAQSLEATFQFLQTLKSAQECIQHVLSFLQMIALIVIFISLRLQKKKCFFVIC